MFSMETRFLANFRLFFTTNSFLFHLFDLFSELLKSHNLIFFLKSPFLQLFQLIIISKTFFHFLVLQIVEFLEHFFRLNSTLISILASWHLIQALNNILISLLLLVILFLFRQLVLIVQILLSLFIDFFLPFGFFYLFRNDIMFINNMIIFVSYYFESSFVFHVYLFLIIQIFQFIHFLLIYAYWFLLYFI